MGSLCHRHAEIPCAPLGRGVFGDFVSRVPPFAITVGPVGAGHARFAGFVARVRAAMRTAWTVTAKGEARNERNPGIWSEHINRAAMPTAWTVIAKGEARNERNPGTGNRPPNANRPNGADGGIVNMSGPNRVNVPCAPLGRGVFWDSGTRVSPFAITVGPVGAGRTRFAGSVARV